jgi:hypothetical protein
MTLGPIVFARYAYPPNALGYCGPDDSDALLEYIAAGTSDAGLVEMAKQFDGMWPYLTLIAQATGRSDPLDAAVVEAYWIGSRLLERVPAPLFATHIVDRFTARAPRHETDLAELALVGRAHHNFHVFSVYPWVGLLRYGQVDQPVRILDSCRIRWGRVRSVHSGQIIVDGPQLYWTGSALALGPPSPQIVRVAPNLAVAAGDTVAMHWDWLCDVLTVQQAKALRHYTRTQLDVANRALARPVADLVLG